MEGNRIVVFVVDDDTGDIELLRRYLNDIPDWEIEYISFDDWAEAREELKRRAVDVIFLDYMLGGETGLDILNDIRDSGDKRPVIVLTGQGDENIAAEITRAGADDYLVKGNLNGDMLRRAIIGAKKQYQLRREKEMLEEDMGDGGSEAAGSLK